MCSDFTRSITFLVENQFLNGESNLETTESSKPNEQQNRKKEEELKLVI